MTKGRTRVRAQTCELEGITVHDYTEKSSMMLLETCAQNLGLPHFASPFELPVIVSSGTIARWTKSALIAQGGIYRLCWCAHDITNSSQCSSAESFRVDVGQFMLLGPAPLAQDRTCVSGQTCLLDGLEGVGLSDSDMTMVLDTCSMVQGDPNVVGKFPVGGLTMDVGASGAIVSWGSAIVTSHGGVSRLCWCAGQYRPSISASNETVSGCDSAEGFRVDFGALTIVGPSPLSDQTVHRVDIDSGVGNMSAVMNIPCPPSLDRAGFIMYTAVKAADRGLLVENNQTHFLCVSWSTGATAWTYASGDDYLAFYPIDTDVLLASVDFGSNVTLQYSVSPLRSPGILHYAGVRRGYKEGDLAFQFEQFNVSGRIDIQGSFFTILVESFGRTCVSGQTCVLDGIYGKHLSTTDRFLVLGTCMPLQNQLLRFAGLGHSVTSSGNSFSVTWAINETLQSFNETHLGIAITGAGGQYRLCWCAGFFPSCTLLSNFWTDMGRFTLLGPSPLQQHRTCVSGQACVLDGIRGLALSSSDRLWILNTCAITDVIDRAQYAGEFQTYLASGAITSWSDEKTTSAGGQYRLCWCAGSYPCDVAAQFKTDVGRFDLIGVSPLFQDRTCVSGQTCLLDGIVGHYLQPGDNVLVLDTCGITTLLQRFPISGNSGFSISASGGQIVTWGSTAVTAAGGQYRLCWRASPSTTSNVTAASLSESFISRLWPSYAHWHKSAFTR
jgi:hypothetical protein